MFRFIEYSIIFVLTFFDNVNSESLSETIWHFPKYSFDKKHTGSEWPLGVVKYKFDQSLSANNIQLIRSVFQEIEQKTCVKFEQRTNPEELYVEFKLVEWESDLFQCYLAEPCLPKKENSDLKKNWRRNRILFSKDCTINRSMIVHALGHALCLCHNYEITDSTEIDHLIGPDLMDIELINKVYKCEGCHRHRWMDIQTLAEKDKINLYNFGFYDQNKRRLIPCRGFVNGTAALGSFTLEGGMCQIYCNGGFHNLTENAQVLTIPNGITTCMEKHNSHIRTLYQYEVVNSFGLTKTQIEGMGIPALESNSSNISGPGYIAFATLSWNRGDVTVLDTVGTAYVNENEYFKADFRIDDVVAESNIFKLLVCREIKVKLS